MINVVVTYLQHEKATDEQTENYHHIFHAFIAIKIYSKSVFIKCSIKQILGMQQLLHEIFFNDQYILKLINIITYISF